MRHDRIQLTEMVRFKAPPGFMDALTEAASRDLSSASEFIRRCLIEKLRERGIRLPCGDAQEGGNHPTPGMTLLDPRTGMSVNV